MRFTHRANLCAALSLLLALSWLSAAAADVVRTSPNGTVKRVRQFTARFPEAMVPFGDPRELTPFDIHCPAPGRGRWVDDRHWAYDFAADLPAGVRCTFSLKDGLRTLSGQPLAGGEQHGFDTGGPAIVLSEPRDGNSHIDEEQLFLIGLDAPATVESVTRNTACVVAGNSERIPVSVVDGDARKAVLDQRKSFLTSYYRVLFKSGAGHRAFVLGVPERGTERERMLALRDGDWPLLMVLKCQRTLPNKSKVELVWGRGIATTTGIATTVSQSLAFETRPAFSAAFSCDRTNKKAQCIPVLPMRLSFTAPIALADARRIRLVDTKGKPYPATISKDDEKSGQVEGVTFPYPLPERTAFRLEVPAGLRDDANRPLDNAARFPLTVRTDPSPPLAKFAARFGILERYAEPNSPPLLAVTVRNIESTLALAATRVPTGPPADAVQGKVATVGSETDVVAWLRRLADVDRDEYRYDEATKRSVPVERSGDRSIFAGAGADTRRFSLPKPGGARAFEVIGIPLRGPGLHVVELASPRLGAALFEQNKPYYVQSAALVTNLAVHLKLGRESSLVWVTRLDRGTPVRDATVFVRDCGGKVHFQGRTDAAGIVRIEKELPARGDLPDCLAPHDKQYFVTARSGDDFSFALSNWSEGIAPWRFNLPQGSAGDTGALHAVLDRSLLRAGETVHIKAIWRQRTREGFAPIGFQPIAHLRIQHADSGEKYELPVQWDARGTATASWKIPQEAHQGSYDIVAFEPGKPNNREHTAGSFRVESFRIPTMRAILKGPDKPLVNASHVDLDIQLSYLSGGGAGLAPVKVRGRMQPKTVAFSDYDDYTFANGDIQVGPEKQTDEPWTEGEYELSEPDDGATDAAPADTAPDATNAALRTQSLRLDATGGARVGLAGIGRSDRPQDLLAELEFSDANGEISTASSRIAVWPSAVVIGLKPDGWMATRDRFRAQAIVLGIDGQPAPGRRARIEVLQREVFSHRKRMLGGFYAFENSSEVKRVGTLCEGTTDARGLLLCEAKAPATGNLILRAVSSDAQGNETVATRDVWVAGAEDEWFAGSDTDRIDLLPEKKRYEPGDTAKLQLRMPFKQATVLVTTEREGVVDSFVRTVTRNNPVIEVPLSGRHAPNIFISAFAVRGRVAGIQPTALVDLGRPAFKMGMAQVRVGWSAFELAVKVRADRDTYRVRDKATVNLDVRRRDGTAPPKGTEVSLAVVDEGLLELAPNNSWNLLDNMMQERGVEVETATAQMQVVGRRHFGRKAVPSGGGGGRGLAREMFDPLVFWHARVKLDDEGHGSATFSLNDSLTAFRIAAVADGGVAAFGAGSTTIRSTQDLILISGLPPLLRENDRFHAGFTLRNASERSLQATLRAKVSRVANGIAAPLPELAALPVSLAPGEARDVGWEVGAPLDADALRWEVEAREDGAAGNRADRIRISQSVVPAVPVRVLQATLAQLEGALDTPVSRPQDAVPGRGGIRVSFRQRLADGLPAVRDYMNRYPYSCLEQLVSRSVALHDDAGFAALANGLTSWLDRDGLAKYFAWMPEGSDTLTAYIVSIAAEAGLSIPEATAARMRQGLIDFVSGKVVRYSDLPTADLALRKLAALDALSRASAFDAKWLDTLTINPNIWPTSAVIDWIGILGRVESLPKRSQRLEEAENILRSRLNFQGTTMGFSTERNDALWWLMIDADVNANRAALAVLNLRDWKEDVPRLVRGALGRQQHGRWTTTVANAWGVLALDKFSQRYESDPVTGRSRATLGQASLETVWDDPKRTAQSVLPWPAAAEPLHLAHDGGGKPWVTVESLAAVPLSQALSSGYRIVRSVTPVEQRTAGSWHRGDVARIHLDIEAQSDMTWVVVDDPVPAGAQILGGGLGRDSRILATGERKQGWVWPAFEERRFDAFRAYYRLVPKGKWSVEYTVRYNQAGVFGMPASHAEAMYAPEMFGDLPNETLAIEP